MSHLETFMWKAETAGGRGEKVIRHLEKARPEMPWNDRNVNRSWRGNGERQSTERWTVAGHVSGQRRRATKAAALLWKMAKVAAHGGAGRDGCLAQSVTQVGCVMSSFSFGHTWQHPPRAAVKKADAQERLRASTQPQDKKHCGADIRKGK